MFTRQLCIPLEQHKSFFLLGPRGTGKTTWLHQKVPAALFINLLRAEFYLPLAANPAHLRQLIPPQHSDWIVIDEIQRVPQLLNEVHDLIESSGHAFILTGSSARKLRGNSVNLLAGRALTYHMHPLTAAEQGPSFVLTDSLRLGNLPARFNEADPARYLRDYVQTYPREEVPQEGLTRNIGQFSRLLETASFSQGSVLNISDVARDAHIHRAVTESYFSILEDLLIATRLPPFTRRAKRQLINHRKFYYFDTGVYRTHRPTRLAGGDRRTRTGNAGPQGTTGPQRLPQPRLRNIFWRTKHGLEVDFVLYGSRGLIAIAIKRSATVNSADLRGLKAFRSDYPEASCVLLYGGEQPLFIDGIRALPLDQAIRSLATLLTQDLASETLSIPSP